MDIYCNATQAGFYQLTAETFAIRKNPSNGAVVTVLVNGFNFSILSENHSQCELFGNFAGGLASFGTINTDRNVSPRILCASRPIDHDFGLFGYPVALAVPAL